MTLGVFATTRWAIATALGVFATTRWRSRLPSRSSRLLARQLALLSRGGIDRPADQERAAQRPIEEIHAARKRVRRAIEKLVAADRGEESDEEK